MSDQQESAQEAPRTPREVGDPALLSKRRTLELSRADLQRRLQEAHADRYRDMLQRALEAVEKDLEAVSRSLGG